MNLEQSVLIFSVIVIVAIFRDYLIGLIKTLIFGVTFYFGILALCYFLKIPLSVSEEIIIGIVDLVVLVGAYTYSKLNK